ncbi:hypothetical protein T12_15645 [Trichinella patagoniensis]|uniref:Uncharacterized protein n=1 Tax=Trichinella patagoniensis TaxID=990121 RepID=A0A0V0YTJ4_9BILA|nr:hypothetical protein T12_15645 [Trichinella patagoniensis]
MKFTTNTVIWAPLFTVFLLIFDRAILLGRQVVVLLVFLV